MNILQLEWNKNETRQISRVCIKEATFPDHNSEFIETLLSHSFTMREKRQGEKLIERTLNAPLWMMF